MEEKPAPPSRPLNAILVGTDEMLLYTRKMILEKQGFAVSTVEPAQAVEVLGATAEDLDLIVACHTLTPDEADALVKCVRSMARRPALVSFSKHLSPLPTPFPFDGSVWSLAIPEAFLSKVREVLRNRA